MHQYWSAFKIAYSVETWSNCTRWNMELMLTYQLFLLFNEIFSEFFNFVVLFANRKHEPMEHSIHIFFERKKSYSTPWKWHSSFPLQSAKNHIEIAYRAQKRRYKVRAFRKEIELKWYIQKNTRICKQRVREREKERDWQRKPNYSICSICSSLFPSWHIGSGEPMKSVAFDVHLLFVCPGDCSHFASEQVSKMRRVHDRRSSNV